MKRYEIGCYDDFGYAMRQRIAELEKLMLDRDMSRDSNLQIIENQQKRISELGAEVGGWQHEVKIMQDLVDRERRLSDSAKCMQLRNYAESLEEDNERLRGELHFFDNKCESCGSTLGLLHQESCPLCKSRADHNSCKNTCDRLRAETERYCEIERIARCLVDQVQPKHKGSLEFRLKEAIDAARGEE